MYYMYYMQKHKDELLQLEHACLFDTFSDVKDKYHGYSESQ
jgi:hypothetical protein